MRMIRRKGRSVESQNMTADGSPADGKPVGKNSLLVVDDVEMNRVILGELFKEDYRILEAEDGKEAIEVLERRHETIAAVLLDVIMPVMDGFGVLRWMGEQKLMKQIPVFLVTADNSEEMMKTGFELGAVDVINKPYLPSFIKKRISNVVELYSAREELAELVEKQDAMLYRQSREIQDLNNSVIETLATAIEFRDCESGQHVQRIHDLTLFFMQESRKCRKSYRIKEEEMPLIATAAIMHDVGKIAIPDYILNKPGRLTAEEFEIMKTHSAKGGDLIANVAKNYDNPIYKYAHDICRYHHERWDGRGYPDGLKGDEIPIWAQIVSLADVYDALVSDRIYKKAYSHDEAIAMIANGECGQFNPNMLECFLSLKDKIKERFDRTPAGPVSPDESAVS